MKRVCVFCGSSVGKNPVYADGARRLGEVLLQRSLGLVFGAGHIGLMGVIADTVLAGGGQAIGVIPQALVDRELAHGRLTELRVVDTMHARKAAMADLADAFIALPGGFGTADELFEILTWAQLGLHTKPIGLLNTVRFFDPLLAWIDHAIAEALIKPKHRHLLQVSDDPETLLAMLASYQPIRESKWIEPAER